MGVPKFYRWLSERYPCLSEVVKEHQIPEFDNLYLDMNGIIHICSHPNDDDPHFRISEEQIFSSIFHYIEVLFRMIQPRKVFFMAVDGVAPRAKMNQQRGRRFRSAKEAELNEKKAKDRGEVLPSEARFDSNCITPGTPFMVRLQSQLQYFVTNKISTDPLWHKVRVVLSGHETPGEGEHKIMDFIRHEKAQPGYDPNVRHCLYGLDADLVMLGMASHDPHFSLLREEVRFGGKKNAAANKRTPTPEETTFHLLHLSLLREYLEHEFGDVAEKLVNFEFDIESIIDDWILLGFLVGNDFLPHLPHLHINKGALKELYSTYKSVLPSLGGYINENGKLNLVRFEKFMAALAHKEMERFDEIYSDAKWLEGKTASKTAAGKHMVKDTPGPANVFEMLEGLPEPGVNHNAPPTQQDKDLLRLLNSADEFLDEDVKPAGAPNGSSSNPSAATDSSDFGELDSSFWTSDDTSGRDNNYHMEFRQHKRDYYISKLGYEKVDASVLKEQAECYVRAIQWNLHYYYDGCVSWSWFYPHHYAPWVTDIRNFSGMKMEFELSAPFLPFEQLMAVLPPASKELVPQALQGLMLNETSPIVDYYPKDFDCDLNGKQQEWEAVVLIKFIDEKKLQDAMKPYLKSLKKEEAARNRHGPMQVYQFTPNCLGSYESPAYFPTIAMNFASMKEVLRSEWDVAIKDLKKGLMDGVRLDVFFPGFPTLKHIPHRAVLKNDGVRVFEQASRGQNMVLLLKDQGRPDIKDVAQELIGAEIWVSWPHMVEAKVTEVKDATCTFTMDAKTGQMRQTDNDPERRAAFLSTKKELALRYKSRWGVDIGETHVILTAAAMTGRKYVCGHNGKITLEKQWSKVSQPYALQTTRKDILIHDPSFAQYRTLDQLYPESSSCFMLGQPGYGTQGEVLQVSKEHKGRVQIRFSEPKEPDLGPAFRAKDKVAVRYFPGYRAAQMLGMSSHLLSRITGTIYISKSPKGSDPDRVSRVNCGLNLKLNKRNEEVAGFSQKRVSDNNSWYYSEKALAEIQEYMRKFPDVFQYLATADNTSKDMFQVEDVFHDYERGCQRLTDLTNWLKESASAKAARQKCGTQALDEEVVKILEATVAQNVPDEKKKTSTMQVRPHLLYKPNLWHGSSMPDETTRFYLFDRVVNVREGYSVPLGLRGTVTGIHPSDTADNQLFDVCFDQAFPGGLAIRSSKGCSYRVPASALINLSHGTRAAKNKNRGGGEHHQQHHSNSPRQQSPRKPMAVVPPLDSNQPSTPHQGVPGVCPPDPKNLPNPTALFGKKNRGEKEKPRKPRNAPALAAQNQQAGNTEAMRLWSSMEQSGQQQAAAGALPSEEAMSRDLSNMLKISQRPQAAAAKANPVAEDSPLSVQAFFKAAAATTSNVLPLTEDGIVGNQPLPSFSKRLKGILESQKLGTPRYSAEKTPNGSIRATVTLPWGQKYVGEETHNGEVAFELAAKMAVQDFETRGFDPRQQQQQQPQPSAQSQLQATAPVFVPMQVSRKIMRTKSTSEEKEVPGPAQSTERVAEWVKSSSANPPPPPAAAKDASGGQQRRNQGRGNGGRGGGRGRNEGAHADAGRGRGRGNGGRGGGGGEKQKQGGKKKTRLAANFGEASN